MEYCICNSIKVDGLCTNKRCPTQNNSLTKWIIEGTQYQFKKAVTLEEAKEAVKSKSLIVVRSKGNPYIHRTIINE